MKAVVDLLALDDFACRLRWASAPDASATFRREEDESGKVLFTP